MSKLQDIEFALYSRINAVRFDFLRSPPQQTSDASALGIPRK